MGNPPENDKALRYIAQLDDARCSGRWKDVPELCRKIEKHAPHRRCLTLTARSEAQVAAYTTQRPPTAASTTASTTASTASTGLSQLIPPLLLAIEDEGDRVQDAFQAAVCLGWLHYVLEEPGLALAQLPTDFEAVAARLAEGGASMGPWSRVCLVKGAFLQGSSHEKNGSIDEAVSAYTSVLPWLSSHQSFAAETAQFNMWAEPLLVRVCQLSDQSTDIGEHVEPQEALRTFRLWARYWEHGAKTAISEGLNTARYRRLAWKAYYDTLSSILRNNLPYNPEPTSLASEPSTVAEKATPRRYPSRRLQQRAEIKRVEAVYESVLLKDTHFPRASESNHEIEAWADAVMDNWRLLSGPKWTDEDLGEGGKEGVSRGVLDILYRAATKTFHSTAILRHLFTVHGSLAEFEMAFKAHESYVEIVTRGKDRAEKTGEEDAGIDDDATVLRTSAEAIRILCRFGSRKEAEKALEIGHQIEKWLGQIEHIKSSTSEIGSVQSVDTLVSPMSLAVAYSAIGISQAQWSRYTYDADARASFQAKAVHYLRRSLDHKLDDSNSIESLYALALVLAETRDVPGAIRFAKRALSSSTKHKSSVSADGVFSDGLVAEFGRERKLIPVWHLLALLLTSRSAFSDAEKACEAAFEQFGDLAILFGAEVEEPYRSEHLNEANGGNEKDSGIVDQMGSFEKSGILQIKMTQLSLLEIIEGSNAAVDGCDELLALYARLFGDPAAEAAKVQTPTTTVAPPKSSVGTLRSSIFRARGSAQLPQNSRIARASSTASQQPSTIATQANMAPAIQVTDEDGRGRANGHHHHLFPHRHEEERSGAVTRTPSKLRKRSVHSLHRKQELEAEQAPEVPELPGGIINGSRARSSTVTSSIRKSMESHDRSLRLTAHKMPHSEEPLPSGHNKHPANQDTRLPAPFPNANYIPPDPRFSKIQGRQMKVTLLIGIWVFISGLYTRAHMYDDARGAIDEALKLAETFEIEVAQESPTSKAFAERSWGGGNSVEELWAHAFTARGQLLAAQSLKHQAQSDFERALLHFPDHPEAIVGLSSILLDIYSQVIPLEPIKGSSPATASSPPSVPSVSESSSEVKKQHLISHTPSAENQISPPELNRLAARDRASALLSTLTKLGAGWDYSEAWYVLARAYEESGQIEKTKEVLWWCVELEDTHPVRSWKNVTLGGFVL